MAVDTGGALVTGAGGRIGRALALTLAEDGWDVAIHYNGSAEGAEQTAEAVRALGRQAVTLRADLMDDAATAALIPAAARALGPLTVLVNNASTFDYDNIHTATRAHWDRHMQSNFRGPFVLTQGFAAQAPRAAPDAEGLPRARAAVVNMIDMRVLKPTPEFMTYSLAKAGLYAFTKTAAQALAPDIRVNGIGPGPTVQGARQSREHFDAQRAATLLERGSSPADMIGGLRFILGADGMTGQMLALDGGQHLAWRTPDVIGVE